MLPRSQKCAVAEMKIKLVFENIDANLTQRGYQPAEVGSASPAEGTVQSAQAGTLLHSRLTHTHAPGDLRPREHGRGSRGESTAPALFVCLLRQRTLMRELVFLN